MTDDEQPLGGVIIHLFGPPPAVEGAPSVDREGSSLCSSGGQTWHQHSPVVDKVSRTVTCGACKRPLDAIDVLLEVASKHAQWNRLRDEVRSMRREVESLRAEEKRVKARTKSHARKDAVDAVDAERARHDESRRIIAYTTDEMRGALDKIDRQIGRLARKSRRG